MYEERRWGTYRVLDDTYYADGNHSLTKRITLQPGKNISYQIHHHRSEVWTFVEGEGLFVLNGEVRKVKDGETEKNFNNYTKKLNICYNWFKRL